MDLTNVWFPPIRSAESKAAGPRRPEVSLKKNAMDVGLNRLCGTRWHNGAACGTPFPRRLRLESSTTGGGWCKLFQLGQLWIRLSTIFSQDNQGDVSVNYGYVSWVLLRGYPRSVHRFASALSSTGLARDLSLERFEWVLLFLQGVPLAAWNLIISVLKKKWFTDAVLFIIVISTYIINYKLNVYPRFKYLSSLNFEIELN